MCICPHCTAANLRELFNVCIMKAKAPLSHDAVILTSLRIWGLSVRVLSVCLQRPPQLKCFFQSPEEQSYFELQAYAVCLDKQHEQTAAGIRLLRSYSNVNLQRKVLLWRVSCFCACNLRPCPGNRRASSAWQPDDRWPERCPVAPAPW